MQSSYEKLTEGLVVAVIVPCYNEKTTIQRVIRDFRHYLPTAEIYVYDNDSSDGSDVLAAEAGATVRSEEMRGKGNVVRRMFSDIDADIYLMVDGDQTYEAASARSIIE